MKRVYSILFVFTLVSAFAKPLEVEVKAKASILMNADTGAVLYEKRAHEPAFPASLTKVGTALFILDEKKPLLEEKGLVSESSLKMKSLKKKNEEPAHWLEIDGSTMGLVRNEILSFESLLHGLLLCSGNDAANVLAEELSGDVPIFVDEMNLYLKRIGCLSTQFKNPHGLHHPEHISTAYDVAKITQKALEIEKFREIFSKASYMKPKTNKQKAKEIVQTNQLLHPGKYYYEKAFGGKTGFTSKAQNNLVAVAQHEGRMLIAVLLGCEKRADRYLDAVRLFETAFQEEKVKKRFYGSEHLFSRKMKGAGVPLKALLKEDVMVAYFPSEEPLFQAFVAWDPLNLPIKKGQRVGAVQVKDQRGVVLEEKELFAKESLGRSFFVTLKEFFFGDASE